MGLIKKWFLRWKLHKIKKKSSVEKQLEEELARSTVEYNRILREAEKRAKLLEIDRRVLRIKEEQRVEELEELEEDDKEDLETQLLKQLIMPQVQAYFNKQGQQKQEPTQAQVFASDAKTQSPKEIIKQELDKMSDEQIIDLTKNFKKS